MADVTRGDGSGRGQVILVTGLMIAVTLLVLVVLLNAVIYTENVATRGIEGDTDEAHDYQDTMVTEFEALLAAENRLHRDEGDVSKTFDEYLDRIDNATDHFVHNESEHWLARGKVVNATYSLDEMMDVWQETSGELPDGDLIRDVDAVHQFTLNVSTSDLYEFSDTADNVSADMVEGNATGLLSNTTGWEIRFYKVENGTVIGGGTTGAINESICDVPVFEDPEDLTINFTNESVNGVDCSGELLGEEGTPEGEDGPFNISVDHHDRIAAQFELRGDGDGMTSDAGKIAPLANSGDLQITFRSAEVQYEANTTIRGALP